MSRGAGRLQVSGGVVTVSAAVGANKGIVGMAAACGSGGRSRLEGK